nr:endogenous retrovirus group K member 13-1 Env polyprotein-like [Macaca nemestrina]
MDSSVEVYTNSSAFMLVPNDDRFPVQPKEEGMHFNLSIGYKYPALCIGMSPGCSAYFYQNWMWTVLSFTNDSYQVHNVFSCNSFQLLTVKLNPHEEWWVSVPTNSNKTKGLPDCPKEPTKGPFLVNSILWNDCNAPKAVVFQSLATGIVIDWAPKHYWRDCSGQNTTCSEFNDLLQYVDDGRQSYRLREWVSPYPFKWMDAGIVPPRPKMIHPIVAPEHPELWKLAAAMTGIKIWNATYQLSPTNTKTPFNITLMSEQVIPIRSCVNPPYMLLVGNIIIIPNTQTIERDNCKLFTCIDATFNSTSILLVRAREEVWIPVSLHRPWESSPSTHTVNEVLEGILKKK